MSDFQTNLIFRSGSVSLSFLGLADTGVSKVFCFIADKRTTPSLCFVL